MPKTAPPKTLESGDPSQMRQGSLELALEAQNEQLVADVSRVTVSSGAPTRQGSLRRALEAENEQMASDVSRVTVAVALPLERGRSGERSRLKVSKRLETFAGDGAHGAPARQGSLRRASMRKPLQM